MKNLKEIMLLVTLLAATVRQSNGGLNITPKRVVVITNNTSEGRFHLTVHCKSKDDDVGEHVPSPNQSYSFSFYDKLFVQTLFYCSFKWNNGGLHWSYIQDVTKCSTCYWSILESVACLRYDYEKSQPTCYGWTRN